jgi:hypothetical protein
LSKVDVEKLATDRHFNLIERILQDVISVEFINVSKEALHVRSPRFTNHKELCSWERLETMEIESVGFEKLDARTAIDR